MGNTSNKKKGSPSQRQLRVSELIKRKLADLILRMDFFDVHFSASSASLSEVRCSPDLKIAKAYVLPLGGKDAEETINVLKEYSFLIRKILSQKVDMKFLPKLLFRKDESFEYAEKIENLIKQTNK